MEKINILLVDDRPENLVALEAILDEEELNLIKANSGNDALSLLLEHDFALILLDVQMPEMDGYEVAKLMRGSEKSENIPIIFVTAISQEEKNVFKGYSSGAVDFLFKPIDEDILKSKVNVFVQLYRQKKKIMEIKLEKRVKQIDTLYRVYGYARMAKPLGIVLNGIAHEIVQAFPYSEYVQSKLTFDGKTYSYPKNLKRFVRKIELPLVIAGVKRGVLQVGYNKKISNLAKGGSLKEERKLIMNVATILTRHMHAREVFGHHREIVKKSFTAIIIVCAQKITYANPRFYRMFRCKKGQVIGRKVQKFLPDCNGQNDMDGKVKECFGRRMTGEDFDLAMITQRIDHHGKPSVLIRINDTSALKKAQKRLSNFNRKLRKTVKEKTVHLEEANKRLQSLNQLKDEFIAITSHELRSPLTSIRGYLSFLL